MTVYVLHALTVTDVSGTVFDDGHIVGVYSTDEKARRAMYARGENYTRDFSDYIIEECEVL